MMTPALDDAYAALLATSRPRIIRTELEYRAALKNADKLMRGCDAAPSADLGAMLDLCALLIMKYEDEHRPTTLGAEPHEIVGHLLQARGGETTALADDLEMSTEDVSRIISASQPITVETARALGRCFSLPPSLFIRLD